MLVIQLQYLNCKYLANNTRKKKIKIISINVASLQDTVNFQIYPV